MCLPVAVTGTSGCRLKTKVRVDSLADSTHPKAVDKKQGMPAENQLSNRHLSSVQYCVNSTWKSSLALLDKPWISVAIGGTLAASKNRCGMLLDSLPVPPTRLSSSTAIAGRGSAAEIILVPWVTHYRSATICIFFEGTLHANAANSHQPS